MREHNSRKGDPVLIDLQDPHARTLSPKPPGSWRRNAASKNPAPAADRRAQQTQGMRLVVPRLFPGMPTATLALLRAGGKRALVTDPASLPDAIEGRGGTHFIGKL